MAKTVIGVQEHLSLPESPCAKEVVQKNCHCVATFICVHIFINQVINLRNIIISILSTCIPYLLRKSLTTYTENPTFTWHQKIYWSDLLRVGWHVNLHSLIDEEHDSDF